MSDKPLITIKDSCLIVNFDIKEEFTDLTMVEKYTNLQALIDMVYKDKEPKEEE